MVSISRIWRLHLFLTLLLFIFQSHFRRSFRWSSSLLLTAWTLHSLSSFWRLILVTFTAEIRLRFSSKLGDYFSLKYQARKVASSAQERKQF